MKKYISFLFTLCALCACAHKEHPEIKNSRIDDTIIVQDQVETVKIPDRVLFGYDKYSLDLGARETLSLIAKWLHTNPEANILVEGHTDSRGTREYNIALGQKRAYAVKRYLASQGIAESRIKIVSYGKEKPEFLGDNEESWAKNRRAVIFVLEK